MKKHYFSTFIKYFFQGILIIGPLSATIWIIWSIFKSVDNLVPDLSKDYPGLVFALVLLGTAIIGFIGSRLILGKLLVGLLDYLVAHIPGVKIIYSSIKDVLASFVGDKRKFSNPVWVRVNENPRSMAHRFSYPVVNGFCQSRGNGERIFASFVCYFGLGDCYFCQECKTRRRFYCPKSDGICSKWRNYNN